MLASFTFTLQLPCNDTPRVAEYLDSFESLLEAALTENESIAFMRNAAAAMD